MSDAGQADAIVSIDHVSKRFGPVIAVDDVSFEIRRNEFFALLGPSGCGKTTILRMIAGLEVPSAGTICVDGRDMSTIPANRRPINMVFQSYAVFPHMSVYDNVAYGLRVDGTPRAEIGPRVVEAIDTVQMAEFAARRPDQLSGGQRQRVALARALVKRPKVLLLDEPLSALDAKLREAMRLELAQLQRKVGITFIIVTHDQDEALSMADRIAVMDAGRVRQIATPGALYERPASRFVADFIGKVNLLDGKVAGRADGAVRLDIKGLGKIAIPCEGPVPKTVTVALRPEKIAVSKRPPRARTRVVTRGRIFEWAYYGDMSYMYVDTEGGLRLAVNIQNAARTTVDEIDIGDEVWLSFAPADAIVVTE
jgi:spermidine/putrescine transport system ATP-binding protein/putrescine transport system ATP-binding protein